MVFFFENTFTRPIINEGTQIIGAIGLLVNTPNKYPITAIIKNVFDGMFFIKLFNKIVKFLFVKLCKLVQLNNINSLFASFTFGNI